MIVSPAGGFPDDGAVDFVEPNLVERGGLLGRQDAVVEEVTVHAVAEEHLVLGVLHQLVL